MISNSSLLLYQILRLVLDMHLLYLIFILMFREGSFSISKHVDGHIFLLRNVVNENYKRKAK